ncbi:MAG TPA: HlyD family efflux transporter periplasmic adaptor subunit [Chloroflexota bacterium]
MIPLALVVAVVAGGVGFNVYRDAQVFVSTDNAQLSGVPIQVGAMNAGRVDSIAVSVGDHVARGAILARVALPSEVGLTQNGQPRLDFLGAADTRVDVQSPVDGVVIGVPAAIGASVQAGQPIVEVVDPSLLWVNANIDETSIDRVKVGQSASVHVDTLNADVPGSVEAITPATAATFSLLPSNTSSGNFNKVVQLVPVRIRVALGHQPALLGTSVEVKIRVAD